MSTSPSPSSASPHSPEEAASPHSTQTRGTSGSGGSFRALRHRNFRLFFIGQAISLPGTWMQMVGLSWLVVQLTTSKQALGTVTLLQFLPVTLLVLFGGVLADRVNKRRLLVITQTVSACQALTLAILVSSGRAELWHLYVLAPVLGLSNAFNQPAQQAFIGEMVGPDDLMNAVGLNSGLFSASRLIGPALAGVLIALTNVQITFFFNAFSFVPVLIALLLMHPGELLHAPNRRHGASVLADLRQGIAYAFGTPDVLLVLILVAVIGTFGFNFTVVLPLLARYVFDRGAAGLGFMTAASGFGSAIAAVFAARRKQPRRSVLFLGGLAFSLILGALALAPTYELALALLVALGGASIVFITTSNTSLQLRTPPELRARVLALFSLLFMGSTPIGGYITGVLAERIGVRQTIVAEAVICLFGLALGAWYVRAVRHRLSAPVEAIAIAR